jgi:hypothetical protein
MLKQIVRRRQEVIAEAIAMRFRKKTHSCIAGKPVILLLYPIILGHNVQRT